MSAIWGCVDLSKTALDEGLSEQMRRPYDLYKIDRFASMHHGHVLMGCGVQHIHWQDEIESPPFFDAEAGLSFTADCILDNRSEMMDALGVRDNTVCDAELLFLAFRRWGGDCARHVRGSFAYAAYASTTNMLTLSADHTFSRSVYYCRQGSRLYFATLIRPILAGTCRAAVLNERWVYEYIGLASLAMLAEPVSTPYQGICKVPPAQYLQFDPVGQHSVQYWFPDRLPLVLDNDEDYQARLVQILESAAIEVTRTSGNVGIFLSSGLDSSAVAAFAAPALEKRGKTLHSYTAVPLAAFSRWGGKHAVTDESEGVRRLAALYANIQPQFSSYAGRNCMNETPRLQHLYEMPVKATPNLVWIDALLEEASAKKCRVLLTGQSGNATISAGDPLLYLCTKLSLHRPDQALDFFNRYCKRYQLSRKQYAAFFFPNLLPAALRRFFAGDYLRPSFVNRETAARLGLHAKSKAFENNTGVYPDLTLAEFHRYFFSAAAMSHVGEADTRLGLYHGAVFRDITKDVRVWEFCFQAPLECFVSADGICRRMIRHYLADRLPAELLEDPFRHGIQSADWCARLNSRWDEVYPQLQVALCAPALLPFIDRKKVEKALSAVHERSGEESQKLLPLIILYNMSLFLQNFGADGTV